MSEETTTQESQELATDSQEEIIESGSENNELIAESKKYRTRAQKAETRLNKLEKQLEDQRLAQMEDEKKYKELADEWKSKYNEVSPYKDKLIAYETVTRNELLEKLPDSVKENAEDFSITALKELSKAYSIKESPGVNNQSPDRSKDGFYGYKTFSDLARADWKLAEKWRAENRN